MEYPPVSVVMPVRNEERHLAESVRHVLRQDYPGEFEIVLAVGPSADRTEQIARDRAGGWDEGMLRAEDWELNHRIRARGGTIWFTPDLRVTYRPRDSVRTLASQYFHYGRWRRVIVREHPETASFRYLAPPGAAALVAAGLVAGI